MGFCEWAWSISSYGQRRSRSPRATTPRRAKVEREVRCLLTFVDDLHFCLVFEVLQCLTKSNYLSKVASVGGPRRTLHSLDLCNIDPTEKAEWVADARVKAILGSCSKTLPSVRSGILCYIAFADELAAPGKVQNYFPPRVDTLVAWSLMFRCEGTWSNYLGYVRTACMLTFASTQASCVLFCLLLAILGCC